MTVVWVDEQGNRHERQDVRMVSVYPDLLIIYLHIGSKFDVNGYQSVTTVEVTDNAAA